MWPATFLPNAESRESENKENRWGATRASWIFIVRKRNSVEMETFNFWWTSNELTTWFEVTRLRIDYCKCQCGRGCAVGRVIKKIAGIFTTRVCRLSERNEATKVHGGLRRRSYAQQSFYVLRIFRIAKDFFSLLTGLFFHRARTCAISTLALIDRGKTRSQRSWTIYVARYLGRKIYSYSSAEDGRWNERCVDTKARFGIFYENNFAERSYGRDGWRWYSGCRY